MTEGERTEDLAGIYKLCIGENKQITLGLVVVD